jgi:hypothetical protein
LKDGGDAVPSREVDTVLLGAPQHDVYTIPSMKGLKLNELLMQWFSHNLHSGVAWKVNEDTGGHGRSAVQKIMPMLLGLRTDAEVATFNDVKPQPYEDQTSWRLAINNSADDIVARFKVNLQNDESELKLRDSTKIDNRKMLVSAVEIRLAKIKAARGRISQPSVDSVFGQNTSSLALSASSTSSSTSTGSNSVANNSNEVNSAVSNGVRVTTRGKGKKGKVISNN